MRCIAPVVLVALLVACSRTPAEPEPASTTTATIPPLPQAPPVVTTTVKPAVTQAPAPTCPRPLAAVAPVLPKAAATCPPDPENGKPLATDKVSFPEANGLVVTAELAMNEHDIEKGLMYRRQMNENDGMLFKLDERTDHTFWMQNTCIPLDMLFIDEDGTLVGVEEGAAPLTTSVRKVGCPSRYVLEMNAGWCRSHGVRPGQKVTLPARVR